MIKVFLKYLLKSFLTACVAGGLFYFIDPVNFMIHSTGYLRWRGGVGLVVGSALFVILVLIFPIFVYVQKSKYPKRKITLEQIEKSQMDFVQNVDELQRKYGWSMVGILFAVIISYVLYDSFMH
jgi:hypothetical protein